MQRPSTIIAQIQELLAALQAEVSSENDVAFLKNVDALELPGLVAAIVDYLQPRFLPYEAAIYWYLFRQSVVGSGQQYTRASIKKLKSGVVTSSRSSQATMLSAAAVTEALRGLEKKGVIVKAGDTNPEGTLYKVCLPEEIAICRETMQASVQSQSPPVIEKKELDFYNVAENRQKVFERDGYRCRYCGKQLTRFSATLDHIQPAAEGGDNSFENLVTPCLHCNSKRGSRPIMHALAHIGGDEAPKADEDIQRIVAEPGAEDATMKVKPHLPPAAK
jgi:hypothetical protein